jgi:hypothetical protein
MVLRIQQYSRLTSETRTVPSAATTDTYTFPKFRGKLIKIEIENSASTDYKVYETTDGTTVLTYILGGAASTVTVATASSFYPMTAGCGTDGVAFSSGTISRDSNVIYDRQIRVDSSNQTASDTWKVTLYYES